ncbi:3',5'-cyclic-nucleotide phosphodiesterase [Apophysomyces sp. BC1015]|nr:3',5'-cyclic-nucleotide phosphodiesterase [Apophysomyces sp. BC1015]
MNPDTPFSYPRPEHRLLRPLDVLALLLASIGHDVGHPGVNNMFMVNTATPLAILYNDRSVLESFHSMAFYHILQQHCFSQLTDIRSHPEYASFRNIVVSSILATDMSLHDEYVQKVRDQVDRVRDKGFDISNEAQRNRERLILCGALIKCADISNCARPFPGAKRWAQHLAEEFFQQGDLEKELGLSVMPINERGKLSLEDFQLSFKRHVALKLFQAVSDVVHEMSFTLDYINENINYWEAMKNDSGVGGEMEFLEKEDPHSAGT